MTDRYQLECGLCNRSFSLEMPTWKCRCPVCDAPLRFPMAAVSLETLSGLPGIGRYAEALPIEPDCAMTEGLTPMRKATGEWGGARSGLHFKVETGNTTGSFKDRGSALVVSAARVFGARRIAVASTGNAAVSLATYAPKFGFRLDIVVPSFCDESKLSRMRGDGVSVHRVSGGYSAAEAFCRRLCHHDWYPGGSDNPYRLEGTKTIAFEMIDQLPHLSIERVMVPVGTGNLLAAVRKGFMELMRAGIIAKCPKLDAVQLDVVAPLNKQVMENAAYPPAKSAAGGINVPSAVQKLAALEAVRKTGGRIHRVTDDAVLRATALLAAQEGIAAEPTGAVCFAAYLSGLESGAIHSEENTVVMVTGGATIPVGQARLRSVTER